MKLIKKLIFFIIIVALVGVFAIGAYLTYVDSNSSKAKSYLLEKYEINEKEWIAIEYTEYVYEDIADCESLWLKKCSNNEELLYTYKFINKNKDTIIVSEDKKGNYTDDYKGKIREDYKVEENAEENNTNTENIN